MSNLKIASAHKIAAPGGLSHALMSSAGGAAGGGVLGGGLGALTELSGTPDEMLGAAGRGALTGAVAGGVMGGVMSPLMLHGSAARAGEHVESITDSARRMENANDIRRRVAESFGRPHVPDPVPEIPRMEDALRDQRAMSLRAAAGGGAVTGAGVGLVGSMWPSIVAERDQKRELGIPTFARTTYQIAPKTAAYRAGFMDMQTKLGAALPIAGNIAGGATLGALGGAYTAPDEDRMRGALLGGIAGGAVGGMRRGMSSPASGEEVMHGLRSSLFGGVAGAATGIPLAMQRDKADAEAYLASPEYQAFLRSQGE